MQINNTKTNSDSIKKEIDNLKEDTGKTVSTFFLSVIYQSIFQKSTLNCIKALMDLKLL